MGEGIVYMREMGCLQSPNFYISPRADLPLYVLYKDTQRDILRTQKILWLKEQKNHYVIQNFYTLKVHIMETRLIREIKKTEDIKNFKIR